MSAHTLAVVFLIAWGANLCMVIAADLPKQPPRPWWWWTTGIVTTVSSLWLAFSTVL